MIEQPRPVVDAATIETRTSRIIAAIAGILGALPATLISFEVITWSPQQVAQYGTLLGLIVALALVFAGQQTKANAIAVEAQVTPIASPMITKIVELGPTE